MRVDQVGRIRWTTDAGDITTTPPVVTVTVSDGRLSTQESFALTVNADNAAPTVTILTDRSALDIGQELTILVHAVDDVAVATKTLTLQSVTLDGVPTTLNQSLSLDSTGRARLTVQAAHLGTLAFVATATDSSGNVGTAAAVTVEVNDPTNLEAPTAVLISPIAEQVVTTPVDVIGTVNDDVLTGLEWRLTATPVDGGQSKLIAEGQGAVSAGVLGRFDPTALRNGFYRIDLQAEDSGENVTVDSVVVEVDSNLKLGNFTLSFTDLEVPVSGIPITVTGTRRGQAYALYFADLAFLLLRCLPSLQGPRRQS